MGKRTGNPNGRPKVEITKEMLIDSYQKYHNWVKVSEDLGVSQGTVYRRLHEYGLRRVWYNY